MRTINIDTLNVMPLMRQVQETGCLAHAKRSR